jgi:hypothetical protein
VVDRDYRVDGLIKLVALIFDSRNVDKLGFQLSNIIDFSLFLSPQISSRCPDNSSASGETPPIAVRSASNCQI